ncbi:MAG: hypothetical protein P4L10_01300 [Acidobacteriaceae bacterium]|nr:hypothetical protein [Acidobacteriaceae bacterium]
MGATAQGQGRQTIRTVAGTGVSGYSGDGGPGVKAEISNGMRQIAIDRHGSVYLTDTINHVIRRVDAKTGIITTVAGNGTACRMPIAACGDGEAAVSGQLNSPRGLAVDDEDNIYVADAGDNRIRFVSASTGKISTVAGTGRACVPATEECGDGAKAIAAELSYPNSVALDRQGNLYINDSQNFKVRKVVRSTGIISTVAGNGTAGFSGDGGAATLASIKSVTGIICDDAGNLYIADGGNFRVRMVLASNGVIATVAGTGVKGATGNGGEAKSAPLNSPYNLAVDSNGNLYIVENAGNQVREVLATVKGAAPSFGNIVAFAGTGANSSSGDGGLPVKATFASPSGIAIDSQGNIFVADTWGARIRKIGPLER